MGRCIWPRNADSSSLAIPSRMVYSTVVLLLMLVNSSTSMFFQRRQSRSCVRGVSESRLNELTSGTDTANIVERLLPNILIPRVPGTPGNAAVRQYISREMRSLGWSVEEDSFIAYTPYGYKNFSNVIATMNPYASTKRIVIACHFDSKYFRASRGRHFLGASDSAVPCAIMMDTARKLRDVYSSTNQNVGNHNLPSLQFLFFDGEEAFYQWTPTDSLYGSRHLAQKWQSESDPYDPTAANNLENIKYFILLDLIGPSDTNLVNFNQLNTSHLFLSLRNIESCLRSHRLLQRSNYRPLFDPVPRLTQVQDDHIPFLQRGVQVLHLISTPFPRVWHTLSDNQNNLDNAVIHDFSQIFGLFISSLLQEESLSV